MQRYLLFDGHCAQCSRTARAVRETAQGKVEARSLHDPLMRALADHPNWGSEPLLLEVDGERVRVRSGLAMRVRLLGVLGPGRAFRLVERLIDSEPAAVPASAIGRRKLLARIAGVALLGTGILAVAGPAGAHTTGVSTSGEWVTDPAILDRLRRTGVVQAATRTFGAPNWDQVYRGGPDSAPFYVLSHPDAFTAICDPVTENVLGFCFRVRTSSGLPQVDWLRPDNGEHVLRTEVDPSGSATSSTPHGSWVRTEKNGVRSGPLSDPTSPDAWMAFFFLAWRDAPHRTFRPAAVSV
ncbi:hypothetical protein [Fodinicola feengrottensis]|uniref:hypothetical protein n=1 Tax=Fodinicola feengrottensis TaxID=435914 RepID=UPI0013D74737|nr:hypothetical protein [Fodinicola feengrottensis]